MEGVVSGFLILESTLQVALWASLNAVWLYTSFQLVWPTYVATHKSEPLLNPTSHSAAGQGFQVGASVHTFDLGQTMQGLGNIPMAASLPTTAKGWGTPVRGRQSTIWCSCSWAFRDRLSWPISSTQTSAP